MLQSNQMQDKARRHPLTLGGGEGSHIVLSEASHKVQL